MTKTEQYKGHVEFAEGHVHHMPLTGIWNVVCNPCMASGQSKDVQFGDGALGATCTRTEGIAKLEAHQALCPHGVKSS